MTSSPEGQPSSGTGGSPVGRLPPPSPSRVSCVFTPQTLRCEWLSAHVLTRTGTQPAHILPVFTHPDDWGLKSKNPPEESPEKLWGRLTQKNPSRVIHLDVYLSSRQNKLSRNKAKRSFSPKEEEGKKGSLVPKEGKMSCSISTNFLTKHNLFSGKILICPQKSCSITADDIKGPSRDNGHCSAPFTSVSTPLLGKLSWLIDSTSC